MFRGRRMLLDHLTAPPQHDLGWFRCFHQGHPRHHPWIRCRQHRLGGHRPELDHPPPASQLRHPVRAGSTCVVGDAELPLGSEDQDQDVGDLVADEIDQQQVAQRLFVNTLLGVGRDLGNVWLGVIAPARQAKSRPSGSLAGQ